jgi:hypothetical protein
VLAALGGRPMPNTIAGLNKLVKELPKDQPLTLVLYRDGAKSEVEVGPLDGKPRAGKLEAEQKAAGKLDAETDSQGTTNFNVLKAFADQDGFHIFASGEGLSYDIRGRFRGGKKLPTAIVIKDDGKVVADVTTLDKVPKGHRKAVDYLLGRVDKK